MIFPFLVLAFLWIMGDSLKFAISFFYNEDIHYNRNIKNTNIPTMIPLKDKEFPKIYQHNEEIWYQQNFLRNSFHSNGYGKPEQKYLTESGKEAIYDGDTGILIEDSRIYGSYNYDNGNSYLGSAQINKSDRNHVFLDIIPYILYGNSKEDTTKYSERLFCALRSTLSRVYKCNLAHYSMTSKTVGD